MSQDENSDNDWLKQYYSRIQNEVDTSLRRRDSVTNWAYSLLVATLAIYFGFFSESALIPQFWRFLLIVGLSVVLIRFFFQSMIAYGFFLRWRYLRKKIESFWMDGKPDIAIIILEIKEYDHQNSTPKTSRRRFWDGQIRSGFIITLIIPIMIFGYEVSLVFDNLPKEYIFAIVGFIAYVILDSVNFILYDQMKKS